MVLKKKELRGMTRAELELKRDELREQLFELNVKRVTQQLEDTGAMKHLKRDLARVLTMVREDELGIRQLAKEGGAKEKEVKKAAAAKAEKKVKK